MSIRALGGAVLFVSLCNVCFASTLVLKSGGTKEGRILDATAEQVYFQSGPDVLNYSHEDIQEITSFSEEEIQAGFTPESLQELRSYAAPFKKAGEIVRREFTFDQIKEKLIAFKNFIVERFSENLKPDEKEVLESFDSALSAPAEVPQPSGATPTGEELIKMFAPRESELHDKILKVVLRYLNEWIATANQGTSSFENEERFIERVFGKTRLAVLKSFLPTLESARDSIDRYLRNLDALRYAADQAILATNPRSTQ